MREICLSPPAQPWWARPEMGRIAYWRNHIVVSLLSFIGIARKVVVDVHWKLFQTADFLTKEGPDRFLPSHKVLWIVPQVNEYRKTLVDFCWNISLGAMFPTSVHRLHRKIARFKDRNNPGLSPQMEARLQILQMELGFSKTFLWCSQHESLRKYSIGSAIRNGKRKLNLDGCSSSNIRFDRAVYKFMQEIQLCKRKIRKDCLHLLEFTNWSKFSSISELLRFLNSAVHNLRNLLRFKARSIVSVRLQIKKLRLFKDFVNFTDRAIVSVRLQVKALIKKLRLLRDFINFTGKKLSFSLDIHVWECTITVITVLLWVEQLEESSIAQLKECLIDLLAKSYSTEFIGVYLRALKAYSLKFDRLFYPKLEMGKTIQSFIYLILPIEYVSIIGAEVMFLIACVVDPPWKLMDAEENEEWNFMDPPRKLMDAEENEEWNFMDPPRKLMDPEEKREWNLILAKAEQVAASEIPSLIRSLLTTLTVTETNKTINVQERINVVLVDFRQKTDKIKAGFRKFYAEILESTSRLFSITNILGTMTSPLQTFGNLKKTLLSKVMMIHNDIPHTKYQFLTLHKELDILIPFLKKIQELEEPMDLWIRISELAYQVGYIIDSIPSKSIPVWYSVMFLSDIIEDVKLIKREIEVINHAEQRHITSRTRRRILNAGSVDAPDLNFADSHTDDAVIGFDDKAEKIVDRLTKGPKKLDAFAIIGMPGQGKTTLAKKVYNSSLVQNCFNKFAWCFVTQIYQVQKLLMDLLRYIDSIHVDEMLTMSEEDLAKKLYECLKGQKYLIILDDIWDITVLNALKPSFPDDNNGSRILFTSRNKFWSESFLLDPLSEEESMELLNHKLLLKDSSLHGDARKILRICNGLPLAIVVVASLLKRVSNNLNRWRELVQNICSSLPNEGCMDILELSYNSLPDVLKTCFLYLAAVVEQTKVFEVEKVFQLWIAEGFVQKSGIKSQEAMAIEYLEDLVGRNLVIVHKRSFTNGVIEECLIHDLFYELCLRKAEEEMIIHLPKLSPFSSKIISYGKDYLRYYNGGMTESWQENAPNTVHSLLIYPEFGFPTDYFSKISMLKFVRVLDIWSGFFYLEHFPKEIVDLICLRYLAIRFSLPFIPLSICNLRNLESFHVLCAETIDFPSTIWKMKALRNINFVCGINIGLNSPDTKLENLESLSDLYLYNVEDAENLLRRLSSVRKLKLTFRSGWKCRWDCENFQVLKTLNKLECLKLDHAWEIGRACALNFPATLKQLSISHFCHPLNKLSSHIGKLPNLEILKLWDYHIIMGEESRRWEVGDEEFLNLKVLKLGGFQISDWEVPESSFPRLDTLVLKRMDYLLELPSSFEDILTLKVIKIQYCSASLGASAMSIFSAQRDIGNEELQILISKDYPLVWRP